MLTSSVIKLTRNLNYSTRLTTKGGDAQYYNTPISAAVEVLYVQDNVDFDIIDGQVLTVLAPMRDALFIAAGDPNLPYLMSPKNGMSIQEAISWIKEELVHKGGGFLAVGKEVPTLTANSMRLVVTMSEPTFETVAHLIFASMTKTVDAAVVGVRVTNTSTNTSVTVVKNSDEQLALL